MNKLLERENYRSKKPQTTDKQTVTSINEEKPSKIVNLMNRSTRFFKLARHLRQSGEYMKSLDEKIERRKEHERNLKSLSPARDFSGSVDGRRGSERTKYLS